MFVLESFFNFIKKRLQHKRRSGVFIVNFEQVNVYWSVFYSRYKRIPESTEIQGYIVDFEQRMFANMWEMG